MESFLSSVRDFVFGESSNNKGHYKRHQKGGSGFDDLLTSLEDTLPSKNVRPKRPRKAKTRTRLRKMEEKRREEQKNRERIASEKKKKSRRLERERKRLAFTPLWQQYEDLLGKSPPKNKYRYDEEWLKRKIDEAETDKTLAQSLERQHISSTPTIFNFSNERSM
jgi:hypothetical protein